MMTRTFNSLLGVAFTVLQMGSAELALANNLLAAQTRTQGVGVPYGSVVPVPLNESGALKVNFVTTRANERVVVQYNAECVLNSPSRQGWLHVSLIVDGVTIPPTSDNSALCSGVDLPPLTGNWVSATAMGVYRVPVAGKHFVSVTAEIRYGQPGDNGGLDDSTIVILK